MRILVLALAFIILSSSLLFATEEFIITTYYPSPYGSYDALWADRFGVGDNTGDGNRNAADVPATSGNVWISNKLGIRTASSDPEFRLTLDKGAATPDGGILAIGAISQGTVLTTAGGGTRLIWYPRKAAFRAGYLQSPGALANWDEANIGYASVAMGKETKASGIGSVAMGEGAEAYDVGSVAFGESTTSRGWGSVAAGYNAVAGRLGILSGTTAIAMGNGVTASGNNSTAMGTSTTASGHNSTAMGTSTTASGIGSIAIGNNVNAIVQNSTAIGQAITVGTLAPLRGVNSVGIGLDNIARIVATNNVMVIMGGRVGIGTVAPDANAALEVAGQVKITGGSPGAGRVLTSDATGLAKWSTTTIVSGPVQPQGVISTATCPANSLRISCSSARTNAAGVMADTCNESDCGLLGAVPVAPRSCQSNADGSRHRAYAICLQ